MELFHGGQYERAIEDFRAAYALLPIPELLFNVAQAYRLKGSCAEAVRYYRQYMQVAPEGRKSADATAQLARLRSCADASPDDTSPEQPPDFKSTDVESEVKSPDHKPADIEPADTKPTDIEPADTKPAGVVPPAPRRTWAAARLATTRRRAYLISSLVLSSATLALLGTAVHFSVETAARSHDISRRFQQHGSPWTAADQALESAGRRDQIAASALYGAAAAVGATAALLLIVRHRTGAVELHARVAANEGWIGCAGHF
jgi:hypothetical protein